MKLALLRTGIALLALVALTLRGEPPSAGPPRGGESQVPPPGWELDGILLANYRIEEDPEGGRGGSQRLHIGSAVPNPEGYGGVSRHLDPAPYRGRRLALTASARAEDVDRLAALWVVVETGEMRPWASDAMKERPIRGTRGWRSYRIVLDVPERATDVYYGAMLVGAGTVWFEGFEVAAVGPEVPSTEPDRSRLRRRGLDFEEVVPR